MENAADWPVGTQELERSWVWRPMPQAGMFRLTGADVGEWLQGQVTQDVRRVEPGGTMAACLCRATGQLEDIVRLRRLGDSWLVFCERPEVLARRLDDFVIMEDVAGERIPGIAATIQGPNAREVAGELSVSSDRTGRGGFDVMISEVLPKPPLSDEAWNLATLEAGEPILGVDADERTLPPELGKAFEQRTISYTKGCYSGQEVLMRIYSRGHTNKTWVGLIAASPIPVGGPVHRVGEHPAYGWVAAATLRNEQIAEGRVTLDGVEAEIRAMGRNWLATSPSSV